MNSVLNLGELVETKVEKTRHVRKQESMVDYCEFCGEKRKVHKGATPGGGTFVCKRCVKTLRD